METLRGYLISVVIILAVAASILTIISIGKQKPDLRKKVLDTIFSRKTVLWIILATLAFLAWRSFPSDFSWILSWEDIAWYLESPSFAKTGEFAWRHWLGLLVFSAIVYLLVEEKKRKPLRSCLNWAALLLFVFAPIIGWIENGSFPFTFGTKSTNAFGAQRTACIVPFEPGDLQRYPAFNPDGGYSSRDKWRSLEIQPGGDSCHVQHPPTGRLEWDSDYPSIHDLEIKCEYTNGGIGSVRTDACRRGAIAKEFVHNTTETPVTVRVAYVP